MVNSDQWLGALLVPLTELGATMDLGLARHVLLVRARFVVVAQRAHDRPGYQFADIGHETLTIVVAAVRLQGDRRVAQAAQVAHRLPVCDSPELRLVQDRFLELGIRNLARRGCTGAVPDQENARKNESQSSGRSCGEVDTRAVSMKNDFTSSALVQESKRFGPLLFRKRVATHPTNEKSPGAPGLSASAVAEQLSCCTWRT